MSPQGRGACGSNVAVAILGAVALGILNQAPDQRLQGAVLSGGVQQAIQAAHGSFVIEPALSKARGADRVAAEVITGTLLPRSIEITDPNDS